MAQPRAEREKIGTVSPFAADRSLRELFVRYRPALFAYFLRRLRNTADADDLAQDVFFRLTRLGATTEIRNAEAFVFQTAINLLRDRARRVKSHRCVGDLATLGFEPSDEEPGPERVIEAKAELSAVMAALKTLSERTRDIFVLRRLEQMKVEEIAMYYGISISAVEHHITKAQAHLAKAVHRP